MIAWVLRGQAKRYALCKGSSEFVRPSTELGSQKVVEGRPKLPLFS